MFNTIVSILRDPIWATILGIIAVAIALWPRKGIKGRGVAWDIVFDIPAHHLRKELADIAVPSELRDALRFVLIRIWNPGDTSIPPSAIYKPITIHFADATIYSAEAVQRKRHPRDTMVSVSLGKKKPPSSATIQKTLLNPQNSIAIFFLIWQESGDTTITVGAKIDGVKQVTRGLERKPQVVRDIFVIGGLMLACIIFVLPNPAALFHVTSMRIYGFLQAVVMAVLFGGQGWYTMREYTYKPMRRAMMRKILYTLLTCSLLGLFLWASSPAK